MHMDNVFSGVTYQVWRLSDLKLLKTANLDIGDNHYGHVSPEGRSPRSRLLARVVEGLFRSISFVQRIFLATNSVE